MLQYILDCYLICAHVQHQILKSCNLPLAVDQQQDIGDAELLTQKLYDLPLTADQQQDIGDVELLTQMLYEAYYAPY